MERPQSECSRCNFSACISGCHAWRDFALSLEANYEARGKSLIEEQKESATLIKKVEELETKLEEAEKALSQIVYHASSHTIALHDTSPCGFADIYHIGEAALARLKEEG